MSRIDDMEKEIIVAMKDMNFEKAIVLDEQIRKIRDGGMGR